MPSRRNPPIITDLDQSDGQEEQKSAVAPRRTTMTKTTTSRNHTAKKQQSANKEPKVLHTISGNFSRRSRSMDCDVVVTRAHEEQHAKQPTIITPEEQRTAGGNTGRRRAGDTRVHSLLKNKEAQLEQLLQRVATLHNFNEQFATENQQLRSENETLAARLADCSRCQKLSTQLSTTATQNKTLQADVEMLKTLVYRLNVQIERYQDQLRASKTIAGQQTSATPTTPATASTLPPWSAAAPPVHTLTPLLKAYDELIADKQDLVENYSREFEHFAGELKRTLEENTRLLRDNEEMKRDVSTWREERTCLLAQLDVCRNKAEAQTQKCDLAKEKLVEVMHCYEQKTQTLMLDMDHLQAAYARCKSELAGFKCVQQQQPPDAIATSLQECKGLLEQLKKEHCKEKCKLEQQIADMSASRASSDRACCELRESQTALQTQLAESNAQLEELRRRSEALEQTAARAKRGRDRLKTRLRIALQWAQKLESGQAEVQSTYDAVRRLEIVVKHKEAQLRGLHERNLEEMDRLQQKLAQKDETIRTLLRKKLTRAIEKESPVPAQTSID